MQFSEIIGQGDTIQKIVDARKNNRLAHALLLTGPPGVGKLALANAIAQYVNCLNPTDEDSCGKCHNCTKIRKGIHPDIRFILPIISKTEGGKALLTEDYFDLFRPGFFKDPYFSFSEWQTALGGENKQLFVSVHEIRALKRKIYLKAFEAPYKVVILWNAEKLNNSAANAFLKLLEEPPEQTLIIMTSSAPEQLISTINSRCQRLLMKRLKPSEIKDYLVRKNGLEEEYANEISTISEGSIGNAKDFTSEMSQQISDIYISWLRAAYTGHYDKISDEISKIYKESKEYQKMFLEISVKKLRDSLLYHLDRSDIALVTESEKAFHENFSKVIDPEKVSRISAEMEKSLHHISGNANPQLVFTALSLRMHQIIRS